MLEATEDGLRTCVQDLQETLPIWGDLLQFAFQKIIGQVSFRSVRALQTLFFRFGEKYNAVFFTSDPVFLFGLRLSFNHGQGMTGMLEGGTERCT